MVGSADTSTQEASPRSSSSKSREKVRSKSSCLLLPHRFLQRHAVEQAITKTTPAHTTPRLAECTLAVLATPMVASGIGDGNDVDKSSVQSGYRSTAVTTHASIAGKGVRPEHQVLGTNEDALSMSMQKTLRMRVPSTSLQGGVLCNEVSSLHALHDPAAWPTTARCTSAAATLTWSVGGASVPCCRKAATKFSCRISGLPCSESKASRVAIRLVSLPVPLAKTEEFEDKLSAATASCILTEITSNLTRKPLMRRRVTSSVTSSMPKTTTRSSSTSKVVARAVRTTVCSASDASSTPCNTRDDRTVLVVANCGDIVATVSATVKALAPGATVNVLFVIVAAVLVV